jgi:hypothetical protein
MEEIELECYFNQEFCCGNSDVTKEHNKSPTDAFILYSSETSILDGTIEAEGESNEGSYSLLLLELQDGNMHGAPTKANTTLRKCSLAQRKLQRHNVA